MSKVPPLPPEPTFPSKVVDRARARFYRELLRELQTGGGMTVASLTDSARPTACTTKLVSSIQELLVGISDRRRNAPNRAAKIIDGLLITGRAGVDLGAGLAPWSIALARTLPDLRIVAVDLPHALGPLRKAILDADLDDRFELVGRDMLRDDMRSPASFDFAIIANVAHLLSESDLRRFVSASVELLRPGGVLAVIDQLLDDHPDWVRWCSLYAVGAPLWMPGGTLYTERELQNILADAGCHWIGAWQLSPLPALSLLAARRK
ncbi:hypothetical protein CKJ65_25140 [Mycobacterium intracellulare]|uniref:class I SAM-dependent methyltransferase n=1 Tax=Mycobacterium intracellulare TaxID=1767 RepID=UPI000BAEEC07|nr:class I SAM-dependent methyltransferase [Mycobacterium intracellulare]PBA28997.1 hypothetical protein CKJ65_25140 [Mycobacterium intracellulare]